MHKWGENTAAEMMAILEKSFHTDGFNFLEAKLYWHNLNCLLFSALNYDRLYHGKRFDPAAFEKDGLISKELVRFEKENRKLLGDFLVRAAKDTDNGVQLAPLREQMLRMELSVRGGRLILQTGKNERDNSGSYYTPQELAKEVIRQALTMERAKVLIESNQPLRIADLSCGGGEFFRAAQNYLLETYQIPLTRSCKYFWGVDIDPIALQISICALLEQAPKADWPEIISHFHLGNPLIEADHEASPAGKSDLFALGRLYAPEMGISCNWLPQEGFDFIFGNPPWEKIRFEERKFFSNLCPEIAQMPKKDDRAAAIGRLQDTWPEVYRWYETISSDYSRMCRANYHHSRIKHSVAGELNTYALFTELSHHLTSREGVGSLIVKSTLVTAPAHKQLWTYLMDNLAVDSLWLFNNKNRIFEIDTRERFAVITLTHHKNERFRLAAGLQRPADMSAVQCAMLTAKDISAINPFSRMVPNINDTEDINELLAVHRRLGLFDQVYPNCHFGRLIHLTAHAEHIDKKPSKENVPIYEGKFIEQYDARFSTFAGVAEDKRYTAKAAAKKSDGPLGKKPMPECRFFVRREFWARYKRQYSKDFSLCWRSLTSPTNARTTIAMILPTCPTCQSIQMLQTEGDTELLMLLGLFNSLPFDYFVRLKMPGLDLTQSVIRQIPVPNAAAYERKISFGGKNASLKTHILSHIYMLLETEEVVRPLLARVNYPVYHKLPYQKSEEVKKALDQLFAEAYQIDDGMFQKMKKSFPKYEAAPLPAIDASQKIDKQ